MRSHHVILSVAVVAVLGCLAGSGGGHEHPGVQGASAISHPPTGGVEGFFFLPPLAPEPDSTSPSDPNLAANLKVEVFLLDSRGNATGDPVATFTDAAEGGVDETIQVDPTDEDYVVNFHTDGFERTDAGTYRVFVRRKSDSADYGFADVQLFSSMKEAKSLTDQTTFALLGGRTLPVEFRIEAGARPPAVGCIVFHSDRDNRLQVYLMDADGGNQRRLTDDPGRAANPCWSPDGTRIAFTSDREGQRELYVMDADGSNEARLTDNSGEEDTDPVWSPDGTRIVFLAYQTGYQWATDVIHPDGSGRTRLMSRVRQEEALYSWSPDSTRIAFMSARDGNREIYVMDADGSNQRRLTYDPALDYSPAWSPDGTRIAFTSTRDGNENIYIMNADGSDPHRLTEDPAADADAAWSPDGTMLSFCSQRDGNTEVYTMDADGSNQVNITNHPGGDGCARWRPVLQSP